MSIVKDLLLLLLFVVFAIKYFNLLKQIKQQKEYFLNVLNHDLKVSTLAQIRGLNLLRNNNLAEEDRKKLIENIVESEEYSLDLIKMLLNTYRFESGENIMNYEVFNFFEILKNCKHKLKKTAAEKGVKFILKMDSNLLLEADKFFIEKACLILLSTAISNSDKDCAIIIFVKKHNENIVVSIVYNGKCLTEEEICRMFSKNSRFSTVGHGIKMNLCKKIIDFHYGNIFVKNLNEKLNSFTFVIPLSKHKIDSKQVNITGLHDIKI